MSCAIHFNLSSLKFHLDLSRCARCCAPLKAQRLCDDRTDHQSHHWRRQPRPPTALFVYSSPRPAPPKTSLAASTALTLRAKLYGAAVPWSPDAENWMQKIVYPVPRNRRARYLPQDCRSTVDFWWTTTDTNRWYSTWHTMPLGIGLIRPPIPISSTACLYSPGYDRSVIALAPRRACHQASRDDLGFWLLHQR